MLVSGCNASASCWLAKSAIAPSSTCYNVHSAVAQDPKMPLVQDDKSRLKSLKDMLHQYCAPAADELIEKRDNGAIQCFACGHRCVDQARPRRRLPRPLQRRRHAARPLRLRRRRRLRPHREEALLPRPARLRCPHLRHARLRFPLRLLPELGHQPDAPRRRRRVARPS